MLCALTMSGVASRHKQPVVRHLEIADHTLRQPFQVHTFGLKSVPPCLALVAQRRHLLDKIAVVEDALVTLDPVLTL